MQVLPLDHIGIFSWNILISAIDKKAILFTGTGKLLEFLQAGKERLVERHAGYDSNRNNTGAFILDRFYIRVKNEDPVRFFNLFIEINQCPQLHPAMLYRLSLDNLSQL